MHKVFELIASMNKDSDDKKDSKQGNQKRIGDKQQEIVDFITENGISGIKIISAALGLKPSRTRDYLTELVKEGMLEMEGQYKNRKYKIKEK